MDQKLIYLILLITIGCAPVDKVLLMKDERIAELESQVRSLRFKTCPIEKIVTKTELKEDEQDFENYKDRELTSTYERLQDRDRIIEELRIKIGSCREFKPEPIQEPVQDTVYDLGDGE